MRLIVPVVLAISGLGLMGFATAEYAGASRIVPQAHAETRNSSAQYYPAPKPVRTYPSPFLPPGRDMEPAQPNATPEAATAGQPTWSVQQPAPSQPTDPASSMPAMPAAGVCEAAIAAAEKKFGLPPYLLQAVALTESGRKEGPWPWAMNIKGQAYYARSPEEIVEIVNRYGSNASIDIGCSQVNLKFHGKRFADWRTLINPVANAEYAAFHLTELRRELGSWGKAVAAYHSRTNWRGAGYACKVSSNYGRLLGDHRKGCGPNIDMLTAYLARQTIS